MKKRVLDGYKTYDTTNGYGHAGKWKNAFEQRMSKEEAGAVLKQTAANKVLGVTDQASASDIKSAFRKKIVEWRPDRNSHCIHEALAMTRKIIAAYSALTT